MAFVPVGRAINPITRTIWEGTGVRPHVEVPEEKALEVAHQLAMEKLAEKASGKMEQAYYQWYGRLLKARNQPVQLSEQQMDQYAGQYGVRSLSHENGRLFYQREGCPRMELLPIDETTFALKDDPDVCLKWKWKKEKQ